MEITVLRTDYQFRVSKQFPNQVVRFCRRAGLMNENKINKMAGSTSSFIYLTNIDPGF